MASRRRAKLPPRTVLIPPREHCWIESDAYDRSAFAALAADAPSLAALIEAGGRLVPHFDALVEDVFCLLFKLEPRWRRPEDVSRASVLNRTLLDAFRDHPLLEHLREETQLDEVRAGLGTVLIGEQVLALLREERLLPRGDLLDLWDLDRQEEEVRGRAADLETLDQLGDAEKAAEAREEVERAAEVAAARLRQKAQNMAQRLGEMPARARAALPAAAAGIARQLGEASEESRAWGTGLGAGGRTSPGRQIELGRRLATNPKLRKLAGVVGRMRQQALALRKRPFPSSWRSAIRCYDATSGAAWSRGSCSRTRSAAPTSAAAGR